MFRPQLAPSLAAIILLALLSGASANVLASCDDRGRRDGPPPNSFKKSESRTYDAKGRDPYGHRRSPHHWSYGDRGYYRPPSHRAPRPGAYYKPYQPSSGSDRLGSGFTIVQGDAWRR